MTIFIAIAIQYIIGLFSLVILAYFPYATPVFNEINVMTKTNKIKIVIPCIATLIFLISSSDK